jgi:hypothetical protein
LESVVELKEMLYGSADRLGDWLVGEWKGELYAPFLLLFWVM